MGDLRHPFGLDEAEPQQPRLVPVLADAIGLDGAAIGRLGNAIVGPALQLLGEGGGRLGHLHRGDVLLAGGAVAGFASGGLDECHVVRSPVDLHK
jgi:hypothetical protein